ncbi:MAG: cytidylate kinase-like family protein [Acidobacteria bacterium]|nr:cytidylate kinase-like family protein [Acidobacteriota bacterium]MCG3191609.1 Cytidylate kinase [Thermoanaerobaculia bacterium]
MERSDAEKCLAFIQTALNPPDKGKVKPESQRPVVTISRLTGAGGLTIAENVADYLNERRPKKAAEWTVFDKNLVQKVLEEHDLPAQLEKFMPEDRFSGISDTVEELLGLHPSSWRLVQQMTETVLRLAEMGSCILVGRGAGLITAHLPQAIHVRLIGSLEARVAHLQELHQLSKKKALEMVESEDKARRRYVMKYLKSDPDDPLHYHLILNTDRVSTEEAARLIGEAVLGLQKRLAAEEEARK